MRIDIMTDIETLGTSPDSTIIQIAAIAFDIKTGEHISTFYNTADISKNKPYEMTVSGETLKWWLNTNKELFTEMINKGVGSSSELLGRFHTWLVGLCNVGETHLWGNGILFDNNMLKSQLESEGLDYPIHYRRDRDVRSILDITCAKLGMDERDFRERCYNSTLRAHDAFNDVVNQIDMVVSCYKELVGSGYEKVTLHADGKQYSILDIVEETVSAVKDDLDTINEFNEMIELSRTIEPKPYKVKINPLWINYLIEERHVNENDINIIKDNKLFGVPVEVSDLVETYKFYY